jgi:hypothetical protein
LSLTQICDAQTTEGRNAAALSRRDDFIRMVNSIRTDLSDIMPDPERRTLREIVIRIPMDYDVTRVLSFRDEHRQRVIEISFGFLGAIAQLCGDFYFASQISEGPEKFDAYVEYVHEMVDRNERALRNDHIKSFQEHAAIPVDTKNAIMGRSDYHLNVGKIILSAIGFILAHEVGHHVLGHLDRPARSLAESRRYEAQADRYAVALTVKMGITTLGALPALAFFATREGKRVDPDATHPLAFCRVLEAFTASFDQIGLEYDRNKVMALYSRRCK